MRTKIINVTIMSTSINHKGENTHIQGMSAPNSLHTSKQQNTTPGNPIPPFTTSLFDIDI